MRREPNGRKTDNINKAASEKKEKYTGKIVGGVGGAVIGAAIGRILLAAGAVLFGVGVCGLAGGAMGAVSD